jgi:uncharacterized membrane protein YccF (DUF307 family)
MLRWIRNIIDNVKTSVFFLVTTAALIVGVVGIGLAMTIVSLVGITPDDIDKIVAKKTEARQAATSVA